MFVRASRLCLLPAVAVVAFATAAPALAQEVDLRPRFKTGAETKFAMVISGANEFKAEAMPGGGQSTKIDQEIDFTLKVKDVTSDGIATVDLTYDRMVMKVGGMFEMTFDSTKPTDQDAGNMLASALRPLIGSSLTMTVDRDGNISKVEGFDKLKLNPSAQQMAGTLATADGVKSTFGQVFSTRKSDGRASVGDTWTNVDSVSAGQMGTVKTSITHTLKSHTGGMAKVDITGDLAIEGGMMPELKLTTSEVTGNYIWDTEVGMLKSIQTKQTSTMQGNPGSGEMTINNTSTMKLERKN